jgi:hypothetical protein
MSAGDILLSGMFLEQGNEEGKRKAHNNLMIFARRYDDMKKALDALVVNYAQSGRVTDDFVRDVARMMEDW